jgi:hypothetical protein
MYVIIVPLEGKSLLTALVIVMITLNVILRQKLLHFCFTMVCLSFKNLLSNSQKHRQCYFHLFRKR